MPEPKFFCDNCGSEVAASEKTCPRCGRYFSSIRCPSCGFVGDEGLFDNGCPKCGYSADPDRKNEQKKGGKKKAKKSGIFGAKRKKNNKLPVGKRGSFTAKSGKTPAKKTNDGSAAFWVYAVTAVFFVAAIWGLLSYMKK